MFPPLIKTEEGISIGVGIAAASSQEVVMREQGRQVMGIDAGMSIGHFRVIIGKGVHDRCMASWEESWRG